MQDALISQIRRRWKNISWSHVVERMKPSHCDSTAFRPKVGSLLVLEQRREDSSGSVGTISDSQNDITYTSHSTGCVISATSTCMGRIVMSLKQIFLTSHMLGLSIHTKLTRAMIGTGPGFVSGQRTRPLCTRRKNLWMKVLSLRL